MDSTVTTKFADFASKGSGMPETSFDWLPAMKDRSLVLEAKWENGKRNLS